MKIKKITQVFERAYENISEIFLNNKIKSDKHETRRNISSMPKMRFQR